MRIDPPHLLFLMLVLFALTSLAAVTAGCMDDGDGGHDDTDTDVGDDTEGEDDGAHGGGPPPPMRPPSTG